MTAKSSGAPTIVKLLLAALVLTALLASFGVRLWRFGGAPPLPALLEGLGDSRESSSQQTFVQRLRERFPPGSKEDDLVQELRKQGFQLKTEGRKEATFDRAAGLQDICRRGGNIHWSADESGKLSDVSGGYYIHCP